MQFKASRAYKYPVITKTPFEIIKFHFSGCKEEKLDLTPCHAASVLWQSTQRIQVCNRNHPTSLSPGSSLQEVKIQPGFQQHGPSKTPRRSQQLNSQNASLSPYFTLPVWMEAVTKAIQICFQKCILVKKGKASQWSKIKASQNI